MKEQMLKLVDNRLLEILKDTKELRASLEYALFSGGKRLRPLLLLLSLQDLGIKPSLGLDVACSLEMIHTYSLIHDDLPAMDNDELRRGKPTVHISFGEDIAILAGDALLTEAFSVLSKCDLDDDKKIKLITLLANVSGFNGMIRGQVLDLRKEEIDLELINEIHKLKTSKLFLFAFEAAAIIAGDKDDLWGEIATVFGQAFQIADDLSDWQKNEYSNITKVIGYKLAEELFATMRIKSLKLIVQKLGKKELYKLVEQII